MSKGARKTGRVRQSDTRATRRVKRPVKTTILIVGEGRETEPNYFRELKLEESVTAKFSVRVKKGHGVSPEQVLGEAIKHKKQAESREEDYDEIWCVLDVEGLEKRQSLDRAVVEAGRNNITLCLSNPCFEVWFLAHFVRRGRSYVDCDAVITELDKHWNRHCKQDYRKNDQDIYKRLCDLTGTAIKNAKWVREVHHSSTPNTADSNSSTDVYRLVDYLIT